MSFYNKKRCNDINDFPDFSIERAKRQQVIIQTGIEEYGLELWELLVYLDIHWSEFQWDEYYERPYAHKVHEDFKAMKESKIK
jgi:hypothetical protein